MYTEKKTDRGQAVPEITIVLNAKDPELLCHESLHFKDMHNLAANLSSAVLLLTYAS